MRNARFWLTGLCLLVLSMTALVSTTAATSGRLQVDAAVTQVVQLKNDNGQGSTYTTNSRVCWSFGTVVQAAAAQHPLRLLSIEAMLYRGFTGAAATAQMSAVVFSIGADGRPDALLARSPVANLSTFYPGWASIPMTYTQLYVTAAQPFLVGIEIESGEAGTIPAVLMDSANNIPYGQNWYSQTCGGSWSEHSEWWQNSATVGNNMVRATVATGVTLDPTWTPTPTSTPTPGPSPTPIVGSIAVGKMAGAGKQHVLARSPDGKIHLIYKTDERQLVHIYSADNGGSWNPVPPLPVARTENVEGVLAAGGDGSLHMVYGPWDGQQAYYKLFSGSSWGAEQPIGDGVYGRNIAVDNRGWVHVFWSNRDVYYTRYDGVNWSQPKVIAANGWHPAVAIGPDNTLHVAYNDANYCCSDSSVEVRYISSSDSGFSWSTPQNVSEDSVWSGGASLIVTPNGKVHLTFLKLSNIIDGSLIYRAWDGHSWSYPEVLSPGNAGTLTGQTGWNAAAMAVDQEGSILVVFQCLNAGKLWDVCLRIHDYFGWLPVVNLTSNVSDNSGSASVVDSTRPITRGVDIAWETNGQIVYRYLAREQWSLRPTPTPTPTATPTPGPIHVRVVDENQNPVNGAVILHNGFQVTRDNGEIAVTANGGVLNLTNAQGGDTLLALMIQQQQPTLRNQHATGADPAFGPAWSSQTFLTSAAVVGQGVVDLYRVPGSVLGEHRLVVKKESPLVLFNIVVSVEWDADDAYLQQLAHSLRLAADYVYDLTDGQMTLGRVQIFDNAVNWADADVQVLARNNVRPHAYIDGIRSNDKSQTIRIGRSWDGRLGGDGAWDAADGTGFRTIGHEFAHYAFGLYDEYVRFILAAGSGLTGEESATCTGVENRNRNTEDVNTSAMDYHYTATELSARNVAGMWSLECERTAQFQFRGESTWETLASRFGDGNSPARWSFTTPIVRNHVVPGPQSLSSIIPGLPVVTISNTGSGTSTPVQTLVVHSPQGVYRHAYVALYKRDEIRVIAQGFTNQDGKLQVFGAEPGDTMRAISIDGGLAGSLTVTATTQLDLFMVPVSVHSAQTAPLPRVRMLALPGRNDGETELLLQLIGFSASAQPKITLVDASGSASTPFVGYSPETGIYTTSVTAGGTELHSGSVVVEATETDRYRSNQLTYVIQKLDATAYQEVFATDGNLGLRFVPTVQGAKFTAAEILVLTSSFLPGALPVGTELVGAVYDISAGAIGALDQAALLSLYYRLADLGPAANGAVPTIYRWDPNLAQWEPLPTQVEDERQVATTSITRLGTYALLLSAPPADETGVYLPLIIDAK